MNRFKEVWTKLNKRQIEKQDWNRIFIYNLPYKIQDVQQTKQGLLISMDFSILNDKDPQKIYGVF